MKKQIGNNLLPVMMLLFGCIAMSLRRQLYMTGLDEKGLLPRGTTQELLLLALTAAAACILFLAMKKDCGSSRYEDNYSSGKIAALGHWFFALAIYRTMEYGHLPVMIGPIGTACQILGIAAPVCLVLAGFTRLLGRKPFFLLHVVVSLFFIIHVVNSYQTWSSDPQMQNYLFGLLSSLALALFAHYTAAIEAGCGSRKMVLGIGLAAVYLCLAEFAQSPAPLLYLGGMIWALTGNCRVVPAPAEEKD